MQSGTEAGCASGSPADGVLAAIQDFEERKSDYRYVARGIILGLVLGLLAWIGTFFIGPSSPPTEIRGQLLTHSAEYQLAYREKWSDLTQRSKRKSYLAASLTAGSIVVLTYLGLPC